MTNRASKITGANAGGHLDCQFGRAGPPAIAQFSRSADGGRAHEFSVSASSKLQIEGINYEIACSWYSNGSGFDLAPAAALTPNQ